jgi:uncharacterized protein
VNRVAMTEHEAARAAAAARHMLESRLPSWLRYHDLAHTAELVVPAAELLAADENLDDDDRRSAVTAAWFHDTGFVERYEDNEEMAAGAAEEELVRVGVDVDTIALVTGAILATRLPQRPVGIVAEIVCDADLFVLGTERFFERDARLREELAASGTTYADAAWDERQLSFVERHRYFTAAARRRNDPTKAANARELRRRATGRR